VLGQLRELATDPAVRARSAGTEHAEVFGVPHRAHGPADGPATVMIRRAA
jgi:hypothetical protein